ncbi:uncharacterized protein [Watersipora subatra]|uniref:uncharacterized protein n=1 Tax=Watersipora subatra TaxID=2589382 RepID=UPI00355B08B6
MMNVVKNYIHSASNHPFVIHGETGVGKTSLMAVASMRVYDWLGDAKDHQLVVVRRFLGTTPDSASVDSLIQSLIKQIAEACKGCKPEQTEDLMQKLDITLKSIPEEYRVVIFLDSLNQLSAYNKAHTLAWLPKDLPSNVKMIVSTLPKAHNILDIIKMRPYSEKHYLKVECLSHDSAMNLIKSWLSDSQRRLTGNQLEIVSKRLQKDKNTNPLYIKLIFDVLVKVRSYMDDSDLEKLLQEINSPEKCIRHIFKELQKTNGNLLVHRLFAYLHLSNLGLTENELVDLISLDDEVLNDVYQFHVPPLRRLPTVLWARIRNSVQNYLVTREANGGSVIAWYHRQFVEVGDAMFKEEFPFQEYKREDGSTPNATELCDLLRASMVDYFLGKWAHEEKPFTYTKKKKSKSKDVSETSTVEKDSKKRYVPAMPNIMENKRPNLRKLGQLPTLLLKLNRIKDFFKEVFGSIDGLTGLFSMNSWSEIYEIADGINFQNQLVVGEDKDEGQDLKDLKITLQILTRSLLLTSSLACTYPRMLGPLLLGRILAFAPGSDYLSKFVVDIYDKGPSLNSFVCPHPQLEGVGTHLIFEMPNDHIGSCVAMIEVVLKGVHYILTLSKQAVLINMEDGNVPLRYIPEDLCKDDSFYLVAAARPMHDPREIVATTKIVPNIYIFSLSQFSWQIIDCRRFDGCKEMVIQALQVDEFYDVTAIFVHGNAHNGLLVFDITSMELLYRFLNKTPILFTSLFDEHLYIIEQTERTVIKLSKDMDTAVAGSNIGQRKIMFQPIETSQPSLKLPAITEVTAKSSVKRDCMILAAKDARVYFVCVRKPESWSYVILDSPAKDVSFSLEDKQENFLMTACTEKYSYILYATEEVAKRKQDVKSSHCIEVIARIEISLNKLCMVSGTFAVGYHLGQLHTFKVDKKNIRLLRKFAAHHRPITSMIVNKDVHAMVLTAAEDGSLKMFHTGLKIGSKMLEASVFDKMNYPIDRISAMGQTTVSLSEHSDSVSIWDTSSGKITSSLKHTLQADECLKDVVCFDDYVVTVTSQGTLSFWKMKNQLIKQRVVSNIHMLSRGCKPNEVLVKCETSWHKFDAATGNMTAECVYDDRVILKHHYVNGQLSLLQRLNEEEELLIEIIDKEGNTEVNLSKEGDLSVDKLHDVFCCQHFFVLLYPREYIFFNWYTKDVVKTEKFNEPTLISSASNTIALKNNQNVQIYRVDKGVDSFRQPCQLQLKIGQENQVFITPDGDYLIVMEQKKMLLMYRVENLSEPIGQYSLYGEAEKVAFTHDSTYIVLGIADTRLFFLMLCDEQKEGHNERVNKLKECFQQAKKVKTARKIVVDAADDQSSDEEMEKDSHESKGNFIKVDMKPIAKDLHSVYSPLRALKECPVNGKK